MNFHSLYCSLGIEPHLNNFLRILNSFSVLQISFILKSMIISYYLRQFNWLCSYKCRASRWIQSNWIFTWFSDRIQPISVCWEQQLRKDIAYFDSITSFISIAKQGRKYSASFSTFLRNSHFFGLSTLNYRKHGGFINLLSQSLILSSVRWKCSH